MKRLTVHEVFYTLQGEGRWAGRPAVFCRFAGCNLWTGREEDRASAICRFCDTEFRGGEKYTHEALARTVGETWGEKRRHAFVVLTGGEPFLQVDGKFTELLHWGGFYVAAESNGTVRRPRGIDWLTVSPKGGTNLVVTSGDELKLVYPQEGVDPADFEDLDFTHFSLQPMDGPSVEVNTRAAIDYCLAHPKWHLSLQTHKTVGLR